MWTLDDGCGSEVKSRGWQDKWNLALDVRTQRWRIERQELYARGRTSCCFRALLGVAFHFHVVLLQLPVERRLADAQNTRSRELVACGFAQSAQNGPALELLEGHQFVLLRDALRVRVLQIARQIRHMDNRAGAERDGALDRVFQLADISRPIVGDQLAHCVLRDVSRGLLR